jgi:hypothetical protein
MDYLFSVNTSARRFQETIKNYRDERDGDPALQLQGEKGGSSGIITERVESTRTEPDA